MNSALKAPTVALALSGSLAACDIPEKIRCTQDDRDRLCQVVRQGESGFTIYSEHSSKESFDGPFPRWINTIFVDDQCEVMRVNQMGAPKAPNLEWTKGRHPEETAKFKPYVLEVAKEVRGKLGTACNIE